MEKVRRGEISRTLCVACAGKLVEAGFKVCVIDTTSRETQTKNCEAGTLEPVEDISHTQEPTTETTQSTKSDQVMDTQEPLLTLLLEEEISQVEEEKDNIQELMVTATVRQEPTIEIKAGSKVNDEKKNLWTLLMPHKNQQ